MDLSDYDLFHELIKAVHRKGIILSVEGRREMADLSKRIESLNGDQMIRLFGLISFSMIERKPGT
jgi:hypothetical protein